MLFCAVVVASGMGFSNQAKVRRAVLKADNGKFLCRMTMEFEDDEGGDETYTAETIQPSKSRPDPSCVFTVYELPGKTIMLQADNGNVLCRTDHEEDFQPLEAKKSTPPFDPCTFTIHEQADGTVALQADNGTFLSRVRRGSLDLIEAYKEKIDVFCKFSIRRV